jgi:hypothetical protein
MVPLEWEGDRAGHTREGSEGQSAVDRTKVALCIDDNTWPYKALQIRGSAQVDTVAGVVPEYALAAERYFGAEQGRAWVKQVEGMFSHMVRIAVKPEWVAVLDFEKRFPSAIEAAMSGR